MSRNYRWALRKLLLPVYGKGLVVDIGSGGRPHPFADIIVEKYTDDSHRYRKLAADGRLILADALHLPFKNNAFSFSMAFHVLEHIAEPIDFLSEVGRISQSGYIETPNDTYEILNPISVHVNIVTLKESTLTIQRKSNDWMDSPGATLRPLYHNEVLNEHLKKSPDAYHTTYLWKDKPNVHISDNNLAAPEWFDDSRGLTTEEVITHGGGQDYTIPSLLATMAQLIRRRRAHLLKDIFACPRCHSDLIVDKEKFICENDSCGSSYPADPVPDFRI